MDPKNTAAYRAAKLAVIILSGLILLALAALAAGIVINLTGHGRTTSAPAGITLAPGARIMSLDSENGRLVLRVRTKEGEEIDIIDTGTGRLVTRITAPAAK